MFKLEFKTPRYEEKNASSLQHQFYMPQLLL